MELELLLFLGCYFSHNHIACEKMSQAYVRQEKLDEQLQKYIDKYGPMVKDQFNPSIFLVGTALANLQQKRVSMVFRHGWNATASSDQEGRGSKFIFRYEVGF